MATRALLLLLLSACAAADPMSSVDLSSTKRVDQVLTQPVARKLYAALAPQPQIRGVMRLIPTPKSCWSRDGVLPYVYPAWTEPRAGEPIAIDWTTRACRPYPNEPAALLISFDPRPPVSLDPFGHRDCYLSVGIGGPRDHIVAPGPGSILSQPEPGRISLRWTPGPEWVGVVIRTQLVVLTGAGNNGWLCSPGLELQIGTAR